MYLDLLSLLRPIRADERLRADDRLQADENSAEATVVWAYEAQQDKDRRAGTDIVCFVFIS